MCRKEKPTAVKQWAWSSGSGSSDQVPARISRLALWLMSVVIHDTVLQLWKCVEIVPPNDTPRVATAVPKSRSDPRDAFAY